jgi:ribosomal protein L11 methylase PrmA
MQTSRTEGVAQRDSGSFRDPGGYVFVSGNDVVRTVNAPAAANFAALQRSGLLDSLPARGLLINSEILDVPPETLAAYAGARGETAQLLVKHPRVPFISYPYEWVFSQLKDAAIAHLDLQLAALERGFELSDATAYNMQFLGGKPVHIDVLSLRPYQEGKAWAGYNQFCRQFLLPLLIEAWAGVNFQKLYRGGIEGITFDDALAILPKRRLFTSPTGLLHVYLHGKTVARASSSTTAAGQAKPVPKASYRAIIEQLRNFIRGLESKRRPTSYWQNYASINSYTGEMRDKKLGFVRDWAARHRPALFFDIGGNSGDYSQAAIDGGAGAAVVLDNDIDSLEHCYRSRTRQHGAILPVFMNLADPTPGMGWRQSERKGLDRRATAGGLIALAVIHHMVIRGNLPLDDAVDWLIGMAPCGVIEFVPKRDPMVAQLLRSREDIFPDYDAGSFRAAVSRRARITGEHEFHENGRLIISYER